MIYYKALLPIIMSVALCPLASAQNDFHGGGFHQPSPQRFGNDVELLSGIDAKKRFGKKFVAGLNFQARLDNNISSFKAALIEASFRYDLHKVISFKTAFRQGWIADAQTDWYGNTSTGTQQRLLFATYLKLGKVDFPLHFQTRLRIENEWTQSSLRAYTFLRTRAKFMCKASKWLTTYIAAEPFWSLRSNKQLTLIRFETGLQWHLGKVSSLHTFYRIEAMKDYFNSKIHVIGLVWNLKFGQQQAALPEPSGQATQ